MEQPNNKAKTKRVSELTCPEWGFLIPIPGGQLEIPTDPSPQDIEEAIKNKEFEVRVFTSPERKAELEKEWWNGLSKNSVADCIEYGRRSRAYHARRIAHFAVNGWKGDPIELNPDGVNINDGLHRLKAAIHLGIQEVEIKIAER